MNNLTEEIISLMIEKAYEARKNSYAPYSHFAVGAALLVQNRDKNDEVHYSDGEDKAYHIITGCNIENAAYSPGNCAERTAVFKAISSGYSEFLAIAIIADEKDRQDMPAKSYVSPCGVCRQVLREFVDEDEFAVIMARSREDYRIMSLGELFPLSFGPGFNS